MKKFVEYVFLTLGASIVAMGLETMLAPNGLVDGGVTALSIMANALWGIPIYVVFLGLNIPSKIFTAKEVSKTFVIRTLYAIFSQIKKCRSSSRSISYYGGILCL